jgi:hypothetical protein
MQVVRFSVALPPLFKKSLRSWQEQYKATRALLHEPNLVEEPAPAVQAPPVIRVRPRPTRSHQ